MPIFLSGKPALTQIVSRVRSMHQRLAVYLEPLMPCNIEKADERMFVHV
jgi:hypothetical protein